MIRRAYLFLFALILFSSAAFAQSTQITQTTCEDSDGGRDIYVQGVLQENYGYGRLFSGDVCSSDGLTLREVFCEGDKHKSQDFVCPNGCKDGACIQLGKETSESVACVFEGPSTWEESCYSARGKCSGRGGCKVDEVKGVVGEKVLWQSSCGGYIYAYTTIEGASEEVKFYCPKREGCLVDLDCGKEETCVKEEVCPPYALAPCYQKGTCIPVAQQASETIACVFEGSKVRQTCSSSKGRCNGIESCKIDEVKGRIGEQVRWSWTGFCEESARPSDAYTTIDGKSEEIIFRCEASASEQVKMKVGESINIGDKQLRLVQISLSVIAEGPAPAYFELWQKGIRVDYFSMTRDSPPYEKNGVFVDVVDLVVGGGDTSYALLRVSPPPSPTPAPAPLITETVKCVFDGTKTEQTCFTAWPQTLKLNYLKLGHSAKIIGNLELKLVQISPVATTSDQLPVAYFELYENGVRIDYFSVSKENRGYAKNGIFLNVLEIVVGSGDSSYVIALPESFTGTEKLL